MILSIFLQASQSPFDMTFIFLMLGIFLVVQFVIIGPKQKKKEKEQQKWLESIANGTKILTSSGIYGKFIKMEENAVVLEIAPSVQIKIDRNYINLEGSKALNKV